MKQLRRGYMRKVDREAYLNAMREIDIHKSLHHESIIELHEVIDDVEDDKVYLIMEAAPRGQIMIQDQGRFHRPGGSLFYSEDEIRSFSRQLVEAVGYLHDNKIIHCDLKP